MSSPATLLTSSSAASATATANSVDALTTTFSPPATCTQNHLTILSSPGYMIWVNEPVPVPSTTVSACYPSQFLDGYTSTSSSSIAPFISPLVCPDGWVTAMTGPSSYIACCPTGYELAPPTVTVSPSRPAYGGTCYSNFASGQTVNITVYNSASLVATSTWLASDSTDQAYGHVIDGIAAYIPTTAANATTAAISTPPTSSTPAPTTSSSPSSSSLSGGAIAGIVIGICALLALLVASTFFLLRRRKHRLGRSQSRTHEVDASGSAIAEKDGSNPYAGNDGKAAELYSPADTTAELPSPPAMHELDGGQDGFPVEMGTGTERGEKEGGRVGVGRAVEMEGEGRLDGGRKEDEKLPGDRFVQ
ncbi:hypothetical protein K490DRAFT_65426 [Saccharata proteae CBS 121410]|uniref:Mid2 domain-containing protein n=1 Tax=Saccharata proteae CBS 121410 TaxID=1314787 RepID=A0A9P4HTA3_9PEZI|nr:hypothetical protein K490DRAFT_65426 [Saccharata proteae CBS 121410]